MAAKTTKVSEIFTTPKAQVFKTFTTQKTPKFPKFSRQKVPKNEEKNHRNVEIVVEVAAALGPGLPKNRRRRFGKLDFFGNSFHEKSSSVTADFLRVSIFVRDDVDVDVVGVQPGGHFGAVTKVVVVVPGG